MPGVASRPASSPASLSTFSGSCVHWQPSGDARGASRTRATTPAHTSPHEGFRVAFCVVAANGLTACMNARPVEARRNARGARPWSRAASPPRSSRLHGVDGVRRAGGRFARARVSPKLLRREQRRRKRAPARAPRPTPPSPHANVNGVERRPPLAAEPAHRARVGASARCSMLDARAHGGPRRGAAGAQRRGSSRRVAKGRARRARPQPPSPASAHTAPPVASSPRGAASPSPTSTSTPAARRCSCHGRTARSFQPSKSPATPTG